MEQESLFSKKALVISALVVASLAVFYVQWKSSALSNASVSLLPCCGAVSFSTELNAVYFMSLCAHLRGPQISPPSSTAADDAAGSWWSRQLASWCVEQLRSQCGVRLHEAAVEWHRRGASFRRNASSVDAAVSGDGAHLDRCLELRFNTRRGDVRPSRVSPLPHTTQTHEWLSRTVDHGRLKDTAPVVTDTSSHAAQQAHQSARPSPPQQGMRTLDRIARPGPMPSSRPSPGGPGAMVQPQSKSSGPLSIIMPIYSVAIVVFFFYTVAKVVTRRSGPVSGDQRCRDPGDLGHGSRVMHRQSCTDTGGVERGSVAGSHKRVSYCNNSDAGSIVSDEARAGTESTTQAADNPPPTDTTSAQPTVSKRSVEVRTTTQAPDNDDVEIEDLKQRLAETEMAMEMIMKQLGSVSAQLSCSPPPPPANDAAAADTDADQCVLDGGAISTTAAQLNDQSANSVSQPLCTCLDDTPRAGLVTTAANKDDGDDDDEGAESLPSETGAEVSEIVDVDHLPTDQAHHDVVDDGPTGVGHVALSVSDGETGVSPDDPHASEQQELHHQHDRQHDQHAALQHPSQQQQQYHYQPHEQSLPVEHQLSKCQSDSQYCHTRDKHQHEGVEQVTAARESGEQHNARESGEQHGARESGEQHGARESGEQHNARESGEQHGARESGEQHNARESGEQYGVGWTYGSGASCDSARDTAVSNRRVDSQFVPCVAGTEQRPPSRSLTLHYMQSTGSRQHAHIQARIEVQVSPAVGAVAPPRRRLKESSAPLNRADLMNEDTGNKPTGITDKHRERVNNSKQLQSGNSAPECACSEDPVVGGADNKCDGGISGDGVDTSQSLVARDQEEHNQPSQAAHKNRASDGNSADDKLSMAADQ